MRIALLFLAFVIIGCDSFEELEASDVIGLRLDSESDSIPADNTSTITFLAFIDQDADLDKRTIKFETTAGSFVSNNENSVEIIAEDTLVIGDKKYLSAMVKLKSNNVINNEVTVSAEIKFFPAKKKIKFVESLPSSIQLSADKFGITNSFDSEVSLEAAVNSNTGVPSSGPEVEFLVFDDASEELIEGIRFRNESLKVNSAGKSTAILTAGNLDFIGDLRIVSRLKQNQQLSDTLIINVSQKID